MFLIRPLDDSHFLYRSNINIAFDRGNVFIVKQHVARAKNTQNWKEKMVYWHGLSPSTERGELTDVRVFMNQSNLNAFYV